MANEQVAKRLNKFRRFWVTQKSLQKLQRSAGSLWKLYTYGDNFHKSL